MPFPDYSLIQTALIAHLSSVIGMPTDVKEANYQGEKFSYPNIRVCANMELIPQGEDGCAKGRYTANYDILVFSTLDSSVSGQRIAGMVVASVHDVRLKTVGMHTGKLQVVSIQPRNLLSDESMHAWISKISVTHGVQFEGIA